MTVCDRGEGGVKNHQKKRDILYGRPLITFFISFLSCKGSKLSFSIVKKTASCRLLTYHYYHRLLTFYTKILSTITPLLIIRNLSLKCFNNNIFKESKILYNIYFYFYNNKQKQNKILFS